jgi:hypothetical protein
MDPSSPSRRLPVILHWADQELGDGIDEYADIIPAISGPLSLHAIAENRLLPARRKLSAASSASAAKRYWHPQSLIETR